MMLGVLTVLLHAGVCGFTFVVINISQPVIETELCFTCDEKPDLL